MKKYELTDVGKKVSETVVFRIRALKDFGAVHKGDLGGYVEFEDNLSHEGNSWIFGDACACGNAIVRGNARLIGNSCISGSAQAEGNVLICENAHITENALVKGNAFIHGNAFICESAVVDDNSNIGGNACICGEAEVNGNPQIAGEALIMNNNDYAVVSGFGRANRTTTFFRLANKSVGVICGCFYGNLLSFRGQVRETHGDTKYAKEYLAIADLMELHFKEE